MRWLRILLICISSSFLLQCSEDTFKVHGEMKAIMHQGFRCWYFKADNGKYFEVVTPSTDILREGLRMYIEAVRVERSTWCGLGDTIEIVRYKADNPKDIPDPPTDLTIR